MAQTTDIQPGGKLADNVVHFTRILRDAGLNASPGQALAALQALRAVGIGGKRDFYWILHATLVSSHRQKPVFDAAFELFWRKRGLIEKLISTLLPETIAAPEQRKAKAASRRVAEAMARHQIPRKSEREEMEIDARMTFSDAEVLRAKDFEQMTAEEIAEARKQVREIVLPDDQIRTRRLRSTTKTKRIDPLATMRAGMRTGGEIVQLKHWTRCNRVRPVVAILDISGSMSGYSEILLHFMHALSAARSNVHTFLFGTRLTNVTRQLRFKDVDESLDAVSLHVEDWSGGTRIADCLHDFNRHWSRRVLAQGANVMLVTDGLERGDADRLAREGERLSKSCHRLVWLNPLLRFDGFEALASGIRALLPHVDEFRPVHNLQSIADLAANLDRSLYSVKRPTDWMTKIEAA